MDGAKAGALVGAVGGLLFVVLNSGAVPAPWPAYVVGAGVFAFVVVLWLVLRVAPDPDAYRPAARQLQAFWVVVGLEVVAVLVGTNVAIRVLDRPDASVPWVALVLGLHWLAFRLVFQEDVFLWLGWFTLTLGVVGLTVALTGVGPAGSASVVSGLFVGAVLLGCVGVDAGRRRRRFPDSSARLQGAPAQGSQTNRGWGWLRRRASGRPRGRSR